MRLLTICALCLVLPLSLVAGDAVEYGVFTVPGVSWTPGSLSLDGAAISPDGQWVVVTTNVGGTRTVLRGSPIAGLTTLKSGLTTALVPAAIDITGLVVGSHGTPGSSLRPVYALGTDTDLTDLTTEGWFNGLSGGNPVGALFLNTPDYTNYVGLRPHFWTLGAAGTPTELTLSGAANGQPAQVDRASPNGTYHFGHFITGGGTIGFFIYTHPAGTTQIVAVPGLFSSATLGDWVAGSNDGTGILRIGDYNDGSGPFRRSYRWNGSSLDLIPLPSSGPTNSVDARAGVTPSGLTSLTVGEASVTDTGGGHTDLTPFRWVAGTANPDLLADLVPATVAGQPDPFARPAGISDGGVILAEGAAGNLALLVPAPEVSISSAAADPQLETGVSFSCTLTRAAYGASPLNTDWALVVQVGYSDGSGGTAIPSTDFTGPATVTIPAGSASVSFPVTLLHNPLVTPDRTLTVSVAPRLSSATQPGEVYRLPGGGSAISRTLHNTDVATNPLPTVSVVATTNANPIPFAVVFSEAVTGFDFASVGSSLTVGGAAGGSVDSITSADATHYTVNVTPSAQGAVSLTIPAGVCAGLNASNQVSNTATSVWDTLAVAPPTVDTCTTDTGTAGDFITYDTAPTVTGTADLNTTVTFSVASVGVLTALTNGSGNWSVSFTTPLVDGSYAFTGIATDLASNDSVGTVGTLVIDTTPPAAPVISTPTSPTADASPLLTGTAEDGSTVTILDGSTPVGSGLAVGGAWSISTSTLTVGTHSITATATDVAGNTGPASAAASVVIDTQGPTMTFAAPFPAHPVGSTEIVTVLVTYADPSGVSAVNLTAGKVQVVSLSGGVTATVGVTGVVTGVSSLITLSGFTGNGTLTFNVLSASATDSLGNDAAAVSATAVVITVDNTPPVAPTITGSPTTTASATPTISGDGAEAGASIGIFETGVQIGTATADGSGNWTVTVTSPLLAGPHNFTIRQTDLAGNQGPDSAPVAVSIDLSGPLPVVTGPAFVSAASIQATVTFSSAVSGFTAGDVVAGGNAGGARTVTVTPVSATVYTIDITGMASPDGSVTIQVPADAAVAVSNGALTQLSNALTIAWAAPVSGGSSGAAEGGGGGGGCGAGGAVAVLLSLSVLLAGFRRRR